MQTTLPRPANAATTARRFTLAGSWQLAALGAIMLLAAALRFGNIGALGYANSYYTAGVKSMLKSWHNFFYLAAEPGGAVSIDKPPLGLWLQALSAYFLGVSGFAVVLPQILAGLGSTLLLYHLVGRSFGRVAGLVAALALAISPVAIATDRNNTIDSTLIFALLLAAWAFIVAAERGRLRYVLLGGLLVGLAFNIKMLQAFLPLPALYGVYLLGSREPLLRKVGNLALASLVLAAVALAWPLVVDLTPANQRPYVGSSTNNTVTELIIGHNGAERLLGMRRGGAGAFGTNTGQRGGLNGQRPGRGQRPGGTIPGGQPQAGPGGTIGVSQIGDEGVFRLFRAPLGKESGWLLPFGVLGVGLLAATTRPHWPLAARHQALVVWGGWLGTTVVFFSIAGFFHEYYMTMVAVPLAAMSGIAVAELWRLYGTRPWLALGLLSGGVAITLAAQYSIARAFVATQWWLPLEIALAAAALGLLAAAQIGRGERLRVAGYGAMVAALLVTPGVWSGLTTLHPTTNTSLPAAYNAQPQHIATVDGPQVDRTLLAFLAANTETTKYLMAVPSAMQGSDYVIATGRPVLYLGGFLGTDAVLTTAQLAQLVADGDLRYIYTGSGGRGFGGGGSSSITSWVQSSCTVVPGFATTTQNSGTPGGTSAEGTTAVGGRGFGGYQIQLYDCAAAGTP